MGLLGLGSLTSTMKDPPKLGPYKIITSFFFFKTKQANKYKLTQKLYIVCRVLIGGAPFTVDVSKLKPNRPNTMNLVGKQA